MKINRLLSPKQITKTSGRLWTKIDDDYISKHGSKLTNQELSLKLNRSISSISWRLYHIHKMYKYSDTKFRARSICKKGIKKGTYEFRFGKEIADKMKEKISLKTKGVNNPFYGRKHTLNTRQNIRQKRIEMFKNGYVMPWKGKPNPMTTLRNLLDNPAKRLDVAQKISTHLKNHPERQLNSLLNRNRMTKIEKMFNDVLITMGYKYDIDYYWNKSLLLDGGYKFPDFFFPSSNLVFEIDGSYWHRDKEKEIKRDNLFNKGGYKIIHIKESEFGNLMEVKAKVTANL